MSVDKGRKWEICLLTSAVQTSATCEDAQLKIGDSVYTNELWHEYTIADAAVHIDNRSETAPAFTYSNNVLEACETPMVRVVSGSTGESELPFFTLVYGWTLESAIHLLVS